MQPEALCWLWQLAFCATKSRKISSHCSLGFLLNLTICAWTALCYSQLQPVICWITSGMFKHSTQCRTNPPARVSVSLMSYVKPWKLWLWSVTSPFPPPPIQPHLQPPFTSVCPQVVRQHTGPSSAPPLLLYFPISLFLKTFSLFLLLSPLFDIWPIAPLRCHYI